MTANADRITRLPVWAQDLLNSLERKTRELENQVILLSHGPEDASVRVHNHDMYPDVPLGSGVILHVYLGASRERYRDMLALQDRPGALTVTGFGTSTQRQLCVSPRSGNEIEIQMVPR